LLPLKPQAAPFIFNVGSDAAEDFNVSTFNAAHGYYRQGMFLLRSAVEGLTHAASFAKRQDKAGLQAWLSGDCESPKFGNARDILLPELGPDVTSVLSSSTRSCATTLTPGLAAAMPRSDGSNGPIWVSESFGLVYRCFRDVMAMCVVMLSVGWPKFSIPQHAEPLFDTPGTAWTPAARAAVMARASTT